MSDLQINSATEDIELVGNDLALTTEVAAIQQHLSQRLKTFLNEWFIDKRIGIPYFEHILRKNFDPVVVDTLFKREIITTPGVLELLSFDADLDKSSRTLQITFKARTSDGVINFSEELP